MLEEKKQGQVVLRMKNIVKTFGKDEKKALSNISLDLNKGEFVFLTGPSGSGKTTLLKLLYRMEEADNGIILFYGKEIKSIEKRHLRRKLGIVFQDYQLLQNKTVLENVKYPLECIGVKPTEARIRALDALDKMGIVEMVDKYPLELSGGQQQRVAIARAIVNKPDFLICDEPTGNLDNENSYSIMEHLNELNKIGTTIIMSTHNEELIAREKDKRVIVLEEGKIVSDLMQVGNKVEREVEQAKDLILMLEGGK